ncbi:MAG: histidine kinase [Desulfobacteraceae bacterium]|nr:histidine kinase [Desulfobacteraceae bacterium]
MIDKKTIILISFGYISLLFAIAFYGDKRARIGKSIISNPYIYALSLAVYCTAWTFYGSIGAASKTGITGFLNIYIGPTLVMILGWPVLKKIIRISKTNKITSIADFIASRYGKSTTMAGTVTIIAVFGIIPYMAVQIKAISATFLLISRTSPIPVKNGLAHISVLSDTAFYVALLLTIFAIVFGTRHIDATERHEGLVAAIAFESMVKLVAFICAGIFITYGLYSGLGDLFSRAELMPEISALFTMNVNASTFVGWYNGLFLSMMAVLFLPRQFQVMVVENVDEQHLKKAIWLFPLYLLAINLFVLPMAFAGMLKFGRTADADFFALLLLMAEQQKGLAVLVFIGGISAATGMVIVETIALSTMICNDLVMPVLLRLSFLKLARRSDLSQLLLGIRRASILLILVLGYLYFHFVVEYYALVSIGMISFAAVAQFGPAILGGIFWKGATKSGALSGLLAGFFIWGYTLVLPSLTQAGLPLQDFLTQGPLGIGLLRPQQLFGLDVKLLGFSPEAHAVFWSMVFNIGLYTGVSIFSSQSEIEQKQAILFVDVFEHSVETEKSYFWRATASVGDLRSLLERVLGKKRTKHALEDYAKKNLINLEKELTADAGLVSHAEKLLAGTIGSASALVMVRSVVKEEPLSFNEILNILDETQQAIKYSRKLEKITMDLETANERLTELDRLKNEFISTVTHELRTPLTSVRALAEILHTNPDLDKHKHQKFTNIIIKESKRLSRLINDVLNFQKIKSGKIQWEFACLDFREIIEDSMVSTEPLIKEKNIDLGLNIPKTQVQISGDGDRLIQVMVNLISNAVKFCDKDLGKINISLTVEPGYMKTRIQDNGLGISLENRETVFREFRQVKDVSQGRPKGTGLGLTITRHIINAHGGEIWVESEPGKGATLIFTLPLAPLS